MTQKQKIFLDVYDKTFGNISQACKKANISRTTYYKWYNHNAQFKEEIDAINEKNIDYAESKLLERIKNGDTTSTIFFLKTKGKSRGYVEQVDNNVTINHFEELMKSLPDEPESM